MSLKINVYYCRECHSLSGKRIGFDSEDCPNCGTGSMHEVDHLSDITLDYTDVEFSESVAETIEAFGVTQEEFDELRDEVMELKQELGMERYSGGFS
ncbi:MAG: hypothetical protein ABEI52_10910 [Halobacteriaceae archaeon]